MLQLVLCAFIALESAAPLTPIVRVYLLLCFAVTFKVSAVVAWRNQDSQCGGTISKKVVHEEPRRWKLGQWLKKWVTGGLGWSWREEQ